MLALLLAATAPAAVTAQTGPQADEAAALCERAIVNGARRAGVPEGVLHAIALTETGRNMGGEMRPWPWAINREGEGHWFATRDEALRFAKASVAAGRTSFDVGCFQVNYRWHGDAFPSLEAMFDMETSGTYAAQFLRNLHGELGDWSAAAGAYHSRTPEFAQRYRARFDRIYANLGGAPLVVAAVKGPGEVEAGEPAEPRRLRTRIAGKGKVITLVGGAVTAEAPDPGIRVERGRVPRTVAAAEEAARPEGGVVLAARDDPL
jgi:hypothetical protein